MNRLCQWIKAGKFLSLLIGVYTAAAITPVNAAAQIKHTRSTPRAEPNEVLEKLERGVISFNSIRSAFQRDHTVDDSIMVRGNFASYTDAHRAQFLDGLERLARDGVQTGDPVADSNARLDAFTALFYIAADAYDTAPQAQEVPTRLMRIYQETKIKESKWSAISTLGDILRISPKESPQIIQLLFSIIKQPVTTRQTIEGPTQYATEMVAPGQALDALIWACEAGVPALRRLYAERDEINDNDTRARIEEMAEQDDFDLAQMEVSTGWPDPCG